MEGRLVAARPGDDGLAGLVAAELQAFEPGRPAAVQDALNADLVAHRRLGGHGAACGPAHLVSETTVATRPRQRTSPARRCRPRGPPQAITGASPTTANSHCFHRLRASNPGRRAQARPVWRSLPTPTCGAAQVAAWLAPMVGLAAKLDELGQGERETQLVPFHLDPDQLALSAARYGCVRGETSREGRRHGGSSNRRYSAKRWRVPEPWYGHARPWSGRPGAPTIGCRKGPSPDGRRVMAWLSHRHRLQTRPHPVSGTSCWPPSSASRDPTRTDLPGHACVSGSTRGWAKR